MVNIAFKKTPIGNLPVEWNYCTAKELMKIETGSRNTEHKSDNGQYPFFVRSQQMEHIDTYNYDCEAVLTAGDGVGTGKVFHYINGKFDAHQRVYVMSQFSQIDAKYFYYFFSHNFGAEVSKYTAKSSVDSVRRNMIADMMIPLPDIDEQKKIAEALSDIDKLISTLEKQIAKKKAIKQGVMQELLSGKRRLAGFKKKWENKKLQEYCSLITKQTGFDYTAYIKPALINQKLPNALPMIQTINFQGREFSFDTDYYIPKEIAEQFPNIILNSKCVLFSIVGASVGNIGLYPGGKAFCGGAIGITRFIDEEDAEWVYYYMCSTGGQEQIQFVTKGGAQATVTIADIRNFLIPTPEKEERKMIVSVLSEIDSEIKALEKKLEKYIGLKQGMMEQLLTGKIRLV